MNNQAFASELEAGIRPLVIETPCRARVGKVKRALCQGSLLNRRRRRRSRRDSRHESESGPVQPYQ